MECGEKIAEISIDLKTRQIVKLTSCKNPLTFRCQRCAVFCCKLGGPKLSSLDIKRLRRSGHGLEDFLDFEMAIEMGMMKNGLDGSCIFLSSESSSGLPECEVYAFRPTLCRLYPFHFERKTRNVYFMKIIPCCNGINAKSSEAIDLEFLTEMVNEVLFDLIDGGLV